MGLEATTVQHFALEQEKAQGKAGRIAGSMLRLDAVILDELGYLKLDLTLFHGRVGT